MKSSSEVDLVSVEASETESISLHGWLVILTIFVTDALVSGGRALFLVVILLWEKDFGWNVASLSGLMAVVHICNGICTPLSGHLIDRKYPPYLVLSGGIAFMSICFACTAALSQNWQVWLVYGIMSGSAYGIVNLNVFSAAVIRCVPKSRSSFAVGMVTSGSTVGHFTLVPCFSLVAESYGWRVGYATLAICTLCLVPLVIVLLKSIDLNDDGVDDEGIDDCDQIDNVEGENEGNCMIRKGDSDIEMTGKVNLHESEVLLIHEDAENVHDIDIALHNDDLSTQQHQKEDTSKDRKESDFIRDLKVLVILPQYWALTYSFVIF